MSERITELNDLLSSLDGLQPASAPDFFYARLQAKMEKTLLEESPAPLLLRPAVLILSLTALLTLNIIAIKTEDNARAQTSNRQHANSAEQFATDYNLQAGDLYQ